MNSYEKIYSLLTEGADKEAFKDFWSQHEKAGLSAGARKLTPAQRIKIGKRTGTRPGPPPPKPSRKKKKKKKTPKGVPFDKLSDREKREEAAVERHLFRKTRMKGKHLK